MVQRLVLLVGSKLENPFKGFILVKKNKKSTGVFCLDCVLFCSGLTYQMPPSEGWPSSEMIKVYYSGLKIWARAQSSVEIGGLTQPGTLSFRLL